MVALPEILAPAAKQAGMKVPEDLYDYDTDVYPHWHVYCIMQLGAACPYAGVHWENAKVVAAVPEKKIRRVTVKDLEKRGFCHIP